MTKRTERTNPCMLCEKLYASLEEAEVCERSHKRERDRDEVCDHGIALDVHCCECRRSGFFPPDDCDCYEEERERHRDEDDGQTYGDPRDERDERRRD